MFSQILVSSKCMKNMKWQYIKQKLITSTASEVHLERKLCL